MADPMNPRGQAPREVHVDAKKINWLAWILLGLGILAALLAIARHSRDDSAAVDTTSTAAVATASPMSETNVPMMQPSE